MLISYYRHELYTSLNAIIGYSELLLEDAQGGGLVAVERGLAEILSACRAFLTFAKDSLSPNRLRELDAETLALVTQRMYTAGQEPIEKVLVNCATLIVAAEESGMYSIIPDLCKIQASGSMLQNLLDAHNRLLTVASQSSALANSYASGISEPSGVFAVSGGKILIIDDNSMNRDLLRQGLERRGYRVEEASGGRQGLEYIQEQAYDLILLDLRMPDLSGLDLLKQLKEQQRLPQLPVVMLSASDEQNDVASCIEYGAIDYLVKPVNLALLGVRIKSYLEAHRHRQREQRLVQELQQERDRTAAARLVGLPAVVAEQLRKGRAADVALFPAVTLLCAQFDDCSRLYKEHAADAFIAHLNRWSALCDALSSRYAVTRIDSALDACIAVANLHDAQPAHAALVASFAEALVSELRQLNAQHGLSLALRIGIHSGPVLAGVFDSERPAFGIWGETFRFARQLSDRASAGEIYISAETRSQLDPTFRCAERHLMNRAGGDPWLAYQLSPDTSSPSR